MKPLNPKIYYQFKFFAQIVLPVIGTLYFALAGVWELPSANAVVGSIVTLDALLGVLLWLSTATYNASDARYSGSVIVGDQLEDGMQNFKMQLPLDAKNIVGKKELVLKVKNPNHKS